MAQLKAQASTFQDFSEVQSDPAYISASAQEQRIVADTYFNGYIATQPEYKKAPEHEKAIVREHFDKTYNIPMPDRQPITTGQGFQHKARPMVGIPMATFGGGPITPLEVNSPEIAQKIQRTTGHGAALALNDIIKGASFGYGDINRLTGDPLQREAYLKQNPAFGPVLQGSELAGALMPIELTANLASRGLGQLQTAGQRLAINQNVPRYLQGIAEKSAPYLRNIGKEIGKIGPIGRSMLEQGLGFGLYESAKAREGKDQFDPMGRAISGIEGAAIGALGAGALGLAGKGIGAAYQGLKNVFTDTAAPASLGKVLQGQVQKTGEASVKYLESTAKDLQNLLEDIFANNAQGKLSNKSIKRLSRAKDRMSRAAMGEISLTTAEVRSHRSALNQIRREVKAGVKAEGRELKPAVQIKAEAQAVQPPEPQAQPKATQAQQPKKLTGNVQEMTKQGLEDSGLSLDEAKALIGEVKALSNADSDAIILKLKEQRKALGNKRDEATLQGKAEIDAQIKTRKDERAALREKSASINPNLRAVLGTEWDGVSAIAKQNPVAETQLKGEAVKDLITDAKEQKVFQAIDDAAQQAKTVKVRHHAEITGSTDAAAKVTAKGNVLVPLSEFTPTHFEIITKNGKEYVTAVGYNELGYESRYYITKSPEGSFIQEVKAASGEQFVGTTPNVYLGPRDYKVADVLSREVRPEGVLTSEAKTLANAAKGLFESDTFKQMSPEVQKILRQINKRGRFEEGELRYVLDKIKKDKKQLEAVCNLFGLK